MSKKDDTQLTSVRVPTELFEKFRIACIKNKFSITKLTERAMFLYITDEEFRSKIHNQLNISIEEN